jgi:hypothetical protein
LVAIEQRLLAADRHATRLRPSARGTATARVFGVLATQVSGDGGTRAVTGKRLRDAFIGLADDRPLGIQLRVDLVGLRESRLKRFSASNARRDIKEGAGGHRGQRSHSPEPAADQ